MIDLRPLDFIRSIDGYGQTPVNAGQNLLIRNTLDTPLFHSPYTGLDLSFPGGVHIRIRTWIV